MIQHNGIFTTKILRQAAKRLGLTVVDHPTDKTAGYIEFPSGRREFFYKMSFGLTTDGANQTAKQKYITEHWMRTFGYKTIPGDAFALRNFENKKEDMVHAVQEYIQNNLSYPIIIKPVNASQGDGVQKIYSDSDIATAVENIFEYDEACMVQEFVSGSDYRLLVFDGKVRFAYRRTPLAVVGDGTSTIEQLVYEKQEAIRKIAKKKVLHIDLKIIATKLAHEDMTLDTVLEKDIEMVLLDNANLSTGGEVQNVTDSMHEKYKEVAQNVARDLGLVLAGVDLMIPGECNEYSDDYHIIEVNSHPSLGQFARRSGVDEKDIEDLYVDALQYMEKNL